MDDISWVATVALLLLVAVVWVLHVKANGPQSSSSVDVLRQSTGVGFERVRRAERFAQLRVTTGEGQLVDMDFAVGWRGAEPVTVSMVPVLRSPRCCLECR